MPADPYDRLPYTDHAYAESHPDRLVAVGRFAGWDAGAIENARVLELGCGRGGNLLPMAAGMPSATFVGIDRSQRQIEEASRIARETGLSNVTFTAASFEEATLPAEAFDFVVCHGVYSWVPAATRRALLRSIAHTLTTWGIAYVSFNTLPGWYERLAARDWLRFFAANEPSGSLDSMGARGSLAWLVTHASPELEPYRDRLRSVSRRLEETDRTYLVHEYLAEEHHPESVTTFLGEADDAGLAYLGDAIPASTAIELLPGPVAERARGLGIAAAEQLVDFVRCTSFRRALLVRRSPGRSPARGLLPEAIESLRIASRLREGSGDGAELLSGPGLNVQVTEPAARHALRELARIAPRSLAFPELVDVVARRLPERTRSQHRQTLARELFDLWLAVDGLDLHAFEPPMVTSPGERPKACPVARWHAAHGGSVTNRWHQEVRFAEPLVPFLLARLDGTRPLEEIVSLARGFLGGGRAEDIEVLTRGAIHLLAAAALLIP